MRGNDFFHICNLFYERTKFFLFGSSFQYRFQSRKQSTLQKYFLDRSINRSIVAFQRTQAINFSASGTEGEQSHWSIRIHWHRLLKAVIPLKIPPHGRDLPYDTTSTLDFPKSAPKISPPPPSPPEFPKFLHTTGNIAISNWSEQRSSLVH